MTKQATVVVENVEIKGPFNSKTGDNQYLIQTLKTSEGDFGKFTNVDAEPLAKTGDTAEILFDVKQGKNGPYNQIVKLTISGSGTNNKNTDSKSKARQLLGQTKGITSNTASAPMQLTQSNNQSARIGGLMHDAVAILIHNASIEGKTVTSHEVVELTTELLAQVSKKFG